jgi:hypothetical protein
MENGEVMTIKRFEDLECWQAARKLVNPIKIVDGLLRYLRSLRSN